MREIKFRGKRIDNGEWVYGNYTKKYLSSTWIHCISDFNNYVMDAVKPETVGQSTGLYDKNGREIYEGDIVVFFHNLYKEDKRTIRYKSKIIWDNGGLFSQRLKKGDMWCLIDDSNLYEIIGNIHDSDYKHIIDNC